MLRPLREDEIPHFEAETSQNIFEIAGVKDVLIRLWGNPPSVSEIGIQAKQKGMHPLVINDNLVAIAEKEPLNGLIGLINLRQKLGLLEPWETRVDYPKLYTDLFENGKKRAQAQYTYLSNYISLQRQIAAIKKQEMCLIVDYRSEGTNNGVRIVEREIEGISPEKLEQIIAIFLAELKETLQVQIEKKINIITQPILQQQITVIEEWIKHSTTRASNKGTILYSPDISLLYPFPNSSGGPESDLIRAFNKVKGINQRQEVYENVLSALREPIQSDKDRYQKLFDLVQELVVDRLSTYRNTVILCPHTLRGVYIHNIYNFGIQKLVDMYY